MLSIFIVLTFYYLTICVLTFYPADFLSFWLFFLFTFICLTFCGMTFCPSTFSHFDFLPFWPFTFRLSASSTFYPLVLRPLTFCPFTIYLSTFYPGTTHLVFVINGATLLQEIDEQNAVSIPKHHHHLLHGQAANFLNAPRNPILALHIVFNSCSRLEYGRNVKTGRGGS